jgi:hypothetical protein
MRNHAEALKVFKASNVPVLELQGKYQGVEELSILVPSFDYRYEVETLAKQYNQECYLESHNDRATSLVYPDGTRQSIGTLTPVSQAEAEASIGYSYNPIMKQFYVTK